jgi:hypothetical protein
LVSGTLLKGVVQDNDVVLNMYMHI